MSNAALTWAWSLNITPTQKLVLLSLADHANTDWLCWPALDRIKQMTGLGQSTIPRTLNELEDAGLIERKRSKGGQNQTTRYRLAVSRNHKQSQSETVSERDGFSVRHEQSQSESQTVSQRDTNHKEPSGTQKKRIRKEAHPLFERWYSRYPLKKSRGDASKAFSKPDPDESLVNEMIEAIDRQTREREDKHQRGQFVPDWKYPATWLRKESWLDESDVGDSGMPSEAEYGAGAI